MADAEPEESQADPQKTNDLRRAMKKMAQHAPNEMVEISAMMGVMGNPLHQKMNEEHINKMLDLAKQHDSNEFELRKKQQDADDVCGRTDRSHRFYCFCIFIALVVFILWVFRNQPAVLVPIISGVGGAALGFVGGTGFPNLLSSNKSKPE